MLIDNVEVELFGRRVKAVCHDGNVMFERESFVKAIGKARASRIFDSMSEALSFLGDDGVEALIADGKEHMLCELLLVDKHTPPELAEYATAWLSAYEILRGKYDPS